MHGIETGLKVALFIPDDHAETKIQQCRRCLCQSVRFWNSTARASNEFSRKGRPTELQSHSRAPDAKPQGNEMPGNPARLAAGIRLRIPGEDGCGRVGTRSVEGFADLRRDGVARGGDEEIDVVEQFAKALLYQGANAHGLQVLRGRNREGGFQVLDLAGVRAS